MTTPQDGCKSSVSEAVFSSLNSTSSATEVDLSGINLSSPQPETPSSQLVNQVFSLFNGNLTSSSEEKGKQFEETAKKLLRLSLREIETIRVEFALAFSR